MPTAEISGLHKVLESRRIDSACNALYKRVITKKFGKKFSHRNFDPKYRTIAELWLLIPSNLPGLQQRFEEAPQIHSLIMTLSGYNGALKIRVFEYRSGSEVWDSVS